jgi:hypothetical protein
MRATDELHADDIRWAPQPVQPVDLLALTTDELAAEALTDAEAYRALAQVALARIAEQREEIDRLARRRDALVEELRRYTAKVVSKES